MARLNMLLPLALLNNTWVEHQHSTRWTVHKLQVCIRYSHKFAVRKIKRASTSMCLMKCHCPLLPVPPTGSFIEVSPHPPRWHLQSFQPLVHHSRSKCKHFQINSSTFDIAKPYPIISAATDQLCEVNSTACLPPYDYNAASSIHS